MRSVADELRRQDAAALARLSADERFCWADGWQASALDRAEPGIVSSVERPVLRASDLILVKLYAGGPQDAWDIIQLLATAAGPRLRGEVEAHIHELPPAAAALWRRIQ